MAKKHGRRNGNKGNLQNQTFHDQANIMRTPISSGPAAIATPQLQVTGLHSLPREILDQILDEWMSHDLKHKNPMRASILPNNLRGHRPRNSYYPTPPVNVQSLKICKSFYSRIQTFYYAANTWSISLDELKAVGFPSNKWPAGKKSLGQANAFKLVTKLHLRSKKHSNWEDAVKVLRAFTRLQEIVFDLRDYVGADWAVDGQLPWDQWKVVPASAELVKGLNKGGVTIGSGVVWVGDRTAAEARGKLERFLEEWVADGADKLLCGPKVLLPCYDDVVDGLPF